MRFIAFAAAAFLATAVAAGAAAPPPAPAAPPPTPTAEALAALSAEELMRAFLVAEAAGPLAKLAAEGQGTMTIGIDGKPYTVNAANAAAFIAALDSRLAALTQAIAARGAESITGQYRLDPGPGCTGSKLDPKRLFSASSVAGAPIMADEVRIIEAGVERHLFVSVTQNRQTLGVVMSGVAIGDQVVFGDVLSLGFDMWGTVKGDTIELRLNADEMKAALGPDAGTEADWRAVSGCVFTLTRK